MSFNEDLNLMIQHIKAHDNFLIVSHISPDGDAISSSLAMAHLLSHLNKSFVVVNQDILPKKFDFLPMFDTVKTISEVGKKFNHLITVDVADYSRAGEVQTLLEDGASILNIDHHPTNDSFGKLNLINPEAAATAEIVFDIVKEMNIPLNKDIATCIYTGLLTDTGGFRYSNTSSKVMNIAAELLEHDITPGDIAEFALETITQEHIYFLKKALDRLEVLENGFIAWTELTTKDFFEKAVSHNDTDGIVNYTRNIEGVEVGLFFKEIEHEIIKVSLRSKKMLDVGEIAKSFGGGGHARAAGYTYHGKLLDAKQEVLTKIKDSKGWNQLGKE